MGHRVDEPLEPSKLRVLGHSLEFPIGPQELKLTEHTRNELVSTLDDLGQRSTEATFLRDVQTLARFHLNAVVTQNTDPGLRHHHGGVLREEQRAGHG